MKWLVLAVVLVLVLATEWSGEEAPDVAPLEEKEGAGAPPVGSGLMTVMFVTPETNDSLCL
jgi:hypothetical protein